MLTLKLIHYFNIQYFNYKRWRPTPQKLKDWQPLRLGCSRVYFLFLELLLVSAFLIFIHLSLIMVFFTAPFPVQYQNFKRKQAHQILWNSSSKRASGRVDLQFSFRYCTVGGAKKAFSILDVLYPSFCRNIYRLTHFQNMLWFCSTSRSKGRPTIEELSMLRFVHPRFALLINAHYF